MTRSYGWVIVAIGALMTCVSAGAMFSLAVFLDPLAHATGWSRAAISTAMTVNFLAMGFGGFFWGAASDRVGPRVVTIIGAVLLGIGLVVASQATSLLVFQLAYGLFVGFASAAFFAPLMSAATAWFVENRSLAVSLVSAGIGVAPMTVSPFARWLISAYEWRFAMLVIGLAVWVLLIPAALFLRRAPASSSESPISGAPEEGADLTAAQALRSPQFIILALTFFLCCSAHAGPIFHMVSYAIVCGVPAMAAVSIYSVEGLAGLGGRVLFGVLADRLGVKRVLAAGLLLQAVAIGSYVFVTRLTEFYTMAVIFGAAYGGVMPLYAALAREYFGQRIMGTVLGAATMLSSLGMAVGPLAGGAVFDVYNSYAWLFIGSFAVGLGAAAIALAFPPLPQRAAARLQPA